MLQHVFALNWELPDRQLMTDPATGTTPNGGVLIEIAQPGANINLNVNEAWAKIYYDPGVPDMNVQFQSGDFLNCGGGNFDTEGSGGPCNGQNGDIDYEFYYADPNPDSQGQKGSMPGSYVLTVNSSCFPNDNWTTVCSTIPLPATGPIDTGTGMKYIMFVKARWINGGSGSDRINAFKVATNYSGGLTGYWGFSNITLGQPSSAGYAVQDRLSGTSTEDDLAFEFATPCSVTSATTVYLKWSDADAGGAPNSGVPDDGTEFSGDNEIGFELQEANIGASSGGVILSVNEPPGSNSNAIGGNGDYRELPFTARPDKVYIWKWKGVNRNNGVQMWIPYDTFYFGKNCSAPNPYNLKVTPACDSATGNSTFSMSWSDAGLGGSGYVANLYKDNGGSPSGPNTTLGQFYNRGTGSTTNTTGPAGFNIYDGTPTPGAAFGNSLTPGTKYWVNVFYAQPPGTQSTYVSFTAAGPCAPPPATIQGRVFYDENGDGVFQPGEPFIRNPNGTPCGEIFAPAVVNVSGVGTATPNACNPNPPGPNEPFYRISVPANKTYSVSLNAVGGWTMTTGTKSIGPTSPNQVIDQWFGMRMQGPLLATQCVGGVSSVNVNWNLVGILSASSYTVDMAPGVGAPGANPNFNNPPGFWYVNNGSSATRPNAPTGFGGFGPSPPSPIALSEGSQYVVRILYSGTGFNVHSESTPFTAEKCPRLSCTDTTFNPTDVETGDNQNLIITFKNIGGGDLAASAQLGVSSGFYNNANITYAAKPLPAGATASTNNPPATPPNVAFPTPGVYDPVTVTVSGDPRANSISCPFTVTVSNRPYFRAYGGDVVAGIRQPAGLNPTWCPGWKSMSTSGINAFSNITTGKGAASQLAALALATIDGFVSTAGQTAPSGPSGVVTFGPPPKLTFANDSGTYGGNAGFAPCPADYFNTDRPASAGAGLFANIFSSLTGMDNGSYYFDATALSPVSLRNQIFTGALGLKPPLGTDRKIAVYVKGDVVIDGDITFTNTAGGWNIGSIPSLYVIVQGNIYVKPGVHQLDGIFVAQPDTTTSATADATGKFYSCANDATTVSDVNFIKNNCNSQLVINGTVIAQHLRLYRLLGTRLNGNANELSNSSNIAEIINAGPETWLTIPAPFTTNPIEGYDSISGLPPVL